MDRIADFFKDFKDRLSNPIFSSFIIAWLIINWKIPIALIFYNNNSIKVDGYKSFIDLIVNSNSWWNYFVYPVIISGCYTFVFPFFRNWILAFQAWIKTWGNDLNLKISRKGKVSTERYILLREKYLDQTKTLEKLLLDETSFIQENAGLKNERVELVNKNNNLSIEVNKWQSMNDVRLLNGEWNYSFKTSIDETFKNYRLSILNGQIYFYDDPAKLNKVETYNIQDFFCNPFSSRLSFTLWPMSGEGKAIFHVLQFPNGITELYGKEDHKFQILYQKL